MNVEDLRADIPAIEEAIYLNTGASGPSPRRVASAVTGAIESQEYDAHATGDPYTFAFDGYEQTHRAVADFIGATPAEIALTNSTSEAINLVAGAHDWEQSDVVVRTDLEHAAGILPWEHLRETRDIEVRILETNGGYLDLEAYTTAVREARLVCVSAITWTHGTRLPVAELVEIAHDAGAQVLVDAVQVVGQVPLDVTEWGADFVAAAAHKWMLGPWGGGFLYTQEDVASDIAPASIGYRSVEDPYASPPQYKQGAGRFEIGTASPGPYAGVRESIAVLEEIGLDVIEQRIQELTGYLKNRVNEERLLSPTAHESGLVSFRIEDPQRAVDNLRSQDIYVRSIPLTDALRVSLHAFNTEGDIDAFLAALDEM